MSEPTRKVAHLSVKSIDPTQSEHELRVIASSPTLDRDLEVIDTGSLHIPVKPSGWKYARDLSATDEIDLPLLEDHNWSVEKQIGSVRSMYINADGELEAIVGLTSLERGQEIYTLAVEKHLGNSISGTFDYSTGYMDNGIIFDAEMIELSVVFKGSNRRARVLEVSKSLLKEKSMTKKSPELEKAYADLEAATKAVEAAELASKDATNADAEAKKAELEKAEAEKAEAEKQAAEQEAADKEAAEKAEAEAAETKLKEEEEAKKMADAKELAAKQVREKAAEEAKQAVKKSVVDKDAIRSKFVEQFIAYKTGRGADLARLNKEAIDLDGGKMSRKSLMKAKAISYEDGAALYQAEVVSTDILTAYQNYGRVGQLVNSIDILGGTQWKRVTRTRGNGFQPVGLEGTKREDQPVFGSVTVLPKEHALIVAWYDAIARETPIAVYQQIVQYIAEEFARLEDFIVLSFAGGTTDGDSFAKTGLVPILEASGNEAQVVPFADYGSEAVVAGMGEAYGVVKSAKELTIVANRVTWGKLATSLDGQHRPIFQVVGEKVSIGALGTFSVQVVDDEVLADDVAVFGAFSDYDLVTRGGLETLFSREATVGNLNLFTDDASAVRASIDIAGKPTLIKSFALLDFGGAS